MVHGRLVPVPVLYRVELMMQFRISKSHFFPDLQTPDLDLLTESGDSVPKLANVDLQNRQIRFRSLQI